jgi:hypothetical protein
MLGQPSLGLLPFKIPDGSLQCPHFTASPQLDEETEDLLNNIRRIQLNRQRNREDFNIMNEQLTTVTSAASEVLNRIDPKGETQSSDRVHQCQRRKEEIVEMHQIVDLLRQNQEKVSQDLDQIKQSQQASTSQVNDIENKQQRLGEQASQSTSQKDQLEQDLYGLNVNQKKCESEINALTASASPPPSSIKPVEKPDCVSSQAATGLQTVIRSVTKVWLFFVGVGICVFCYLSQFQLLRQRVSLLVPNQENRMH